MSSPMVDTDDRRKDAESIRVALGVAVPFAVVALAYGLWSLSHRLLYIGPLDRAAFGWAVVIPVWVGVPIASAYVWHRLTPRSSRVAAAVVGASVSSVATVLFWQAVAFPECEFGAVRTAIDWIMPALLVGVVIGAGLVVSGLLATTLVRGGHPWRAVAIGAGTELAFVFGAILVTGVVLLSPGCQRPIVAP